MTLGIGAATEVPSGVISFVLSGDVVPKARPRFTVNGRVYTPAKTKAYERAIGHAAKISTLNRTIPTGALVVTVEAVLGVPRSWTAKRRQSALDGTTRPDRARADLDNIVKAVLDGCNGILWADDRQVCEIHATKSYGPEPYLRVTVRAL